MTRFGSLILCATLGSSLLACGSSNTSSTSQGGDSGGKSGTAGSGGTTSTKDPIELVPLDNDVPGWTVEDPGQRAMVGKTFKEVTDLIDGGSDKYYTIDGAFTPKEFLWQNYKNTSLSSVPSPDVAIVKLYIFQMPSADQAAGLYGRTLKDQDHKPYTWQDPTTPSVGTASRIANTGSQWLFNFHQGVYYVELSLKPSDGPAPDFLPDNAETKQEAFHFGQAIAAKI
jgi:hypothetical protein